MLRKYTYNSSFKNRISKRFKPSWEIKCIISKGQLSHMIKHTAFFSYKERRYAKKSIICIIFTNFPSTRNNYSKISTYF